MAAVLARLSAIFESDPLIDEYALVPRASPELFGAPGDGEEVDWGCVSAEHKLAVSFEAAVVLYRHAYGKMRGCETVSASGPATAPQANVQAATARAALICCADCASAWACREDLLRAGVLDVHGELAFTALLLRTNHKSGETWAYRRHLLRELLKHPEGKDVGQVFGSELEFVEELARKYDHHYYAWNHWAWLGRLPWRSDAPAPEDLQFPRLAFVTPSHYGLFHHRLVRLQELFRDPQGAQVAGDWAKGAALELQLPVEALDAFAEEQKLASSLLGTFPHMEAPWLFRLQLFAALLEAVQATGAGGVSGAPEASGHAGHTGAAGRRGKALARVGELWRAEVAFASQCEVDASIADGPAAMAARRFARRFQVHALEEFSAHLQGLAEVLAHRAGDRSLPLLATLGEEALAALDELEREGAASSAAVATASAVAEAVALAAKPTAAATAEAGALSVVAAPAVLAAIRRDLQEVTCVQQDRPPGATPLPA